MNNMLEVGDYVWSIMSPEEMNWYKGMFKPTSIKKPQQKRIVQIQETDDGYIYGVKGYHFHENMIGCIIFLSEEKANKAMKYKDGIMEMRGNINEV